MTLLSIAAASAIQHFDPKLNKKPGGKDRRSLHHLRREVLPVAKRDSR